MARIPQEEIDRIKREVRIEDLVRAKGIELKSHGENLVGRCCWHEDDTPSLIVTPSKNLWLCGVPHNQSYAEHSIMRS